MTFIQLEKASKRYQTGDEWFYAAKEVDLQIEQGDFVAIMGPSGSGKSTIMHLLGLLDTPTEGDVWINGMATSTLAEAQLAKLRNQQIGFVFQSFYLQARRSILDNIILPLEYAAKKITPQQARNRAAESLRKVGLNPQAKGDHFPSQLSGGQQQRVAIARAIVNKPILILADEPTGNLDSQSTIEILALFQQLNREGTTIILVTHEEEVGQHAQKIIRFRDGMIMSEEKVQNRLRTPVENI